MKILFIICPFLLLSYACTNKNKLPKDIFPKEKMQSILWDMMRTGEFLNNYVFNKDTGINQAAESQKWYSKIYELHKTTKAAFDKSYAYYKIHPALMKEVMDSISKKELPPETPVETIHKLADSVAKPIPAISMEKQKMMVDSFKRKKLIKGHLK